MTAAYALGVNHGGRLVHVMSTMFLIEKVEGQSDSLSPLCISLSSR